MVREVEARYFADQEQFIRRECKKYNIPLNSKNSGSPYNVKNLRSLADIQKMVDRLENDGYRLATTYDDGDERQSVSGEVYVKEEDGLRSVVTLEEEISGDKSSYIMACGYNDTDDDELF